MPASSYDSRSFVPECLRVPPDVIDHHQTMMAGADRLIALGPGAGHDGGWIVFEGTPAALVTARSTPTGQRLAVYVGAYL